ncbi:TIR domain-containing adapter molecule 1 [Xiphias gladius]|uniref:TIR domain-containing adapter molecule 1 n=1 Tax=Xiphias gladius TaxID=8245 RepID=UPI001A991B25|nr:TIR domain-containing adapter molecule 1 [Xiphias gladius]XP_039998895.1 TIR domain-containing adapter molecule 1 [Xiphias gladius]XP_039998896.1 TIR domain-containing adapter molecule 1 [Xiphias gladius]XP_039998897.1 TIR domain-containing adapter molecule 1 [Xiphias gladius]
MSHEGQGNPGTGLRDIFDILVKEPTERLISLTVQLGESPEDNIIHALCLIILQREEQALNKLQMLKDNCLANHLAERWQMSGGKLEEFGVHCGWFQKFTGESLAALARIFKVLSERRLCDPLLRNLAYQRALSIDSQKTSNCEDLEYDQLREEAKVVCGPQFGEWIFSSRDLKSGSYHDPHRSLDEVNTTLKITDQSERAYSLPSPLQASSSMPSYPTHLEISIPPTASFQGDKTSPDISDKSKLNTCALLAPVQSQSSEDPQPISNEPALLEARKDSKIDAAESKKLDRHIAPNDTPNKTTKPSTEPRFALATATNTFLPKVPFPNEMHESKSAEEEEEAIFYAFVILHAPEDADVAESMKEKLETFTGCEGATFSEDFAIPGKSTLRCVEDAINNSAFTLLLLTRNFNTRMVEMETDSALINSINKKYKHNTVIPLLPGENCMPRQSIPMVLQTIVPLQENRNFEKKVKKSLSPAKIKDQKRIWTEGQRMKSQIERQEELKRLNQYQKQLIQECKISQSLERENLNFLMAQKLLLSPSVPPEQDGGDGRARWQQQQPNIHIENAKYIMIGNDSQMTLDFCGGTNKDDSIHSEEEQ